MLLDNFIAGPWVPVCNDRGINRKRVNISREPVTVFGRQAISRILARGPFEIVVPPRYPVGQALFLYASRNQPFGRFFS